MKINVDQSSVGVGKTHFAIERAIKFSGLWLFAVERIDSINEIAQRIKVIAEQQKVSLDIVPISSEPDDGKINRGNSVRTEVESLAEKYKNGHVIAICSHAAMMMTDFKKFTDWHFICDEVPSLLDITKKQTKLDLLFFEKYFELDPITTGQNAWSLFKLTPDGMKLTGKDLVSDDSHKHLTKLHLVAMLAQQDKIAKFPVTTLTKLEDMEGDKVYWVWWSLLSINHFKPFKSVTFLASKFMDSITRKIIDSWHRNIEWIPTVRQSNRQFKKRNVSIIYYADRNATISFLESSSGREHLRVISKDIAASTQSSKLIWSANEKVKPYLLALGEQSYFKPKQAGTDKLMSKTQAAIIYSAYPAQYVLKVLKVFDIGNDDWIRTNEYEVILQFVSRTSVRDANSSSDVEIFVYNKKQAEYLYDFFSEHPHNQVSIKFRDLNLKYNASKRGRPSLNLSVEEAAKNATKKRERDRVTQRARRARKSKK